MEDYTILSKYIYPTQCGNLEFFLSDILYVIEEYTSSSISGIAISLPGYINPKSSFSHQAGSITALDNPEKRRLISYKPSASMVVRKNNVLKSDLLSATFAVLF
ncbi:beta-glucoside kinase [Mesobacillus foraminis]|uniref:Beta-glucoside kinase n=1 Tax=Mesobacillus foraminis TaxID=279826 RepID=A0A4R2B6V3_9BACI|nr:beta-glucoside kinase [Mesobacillus foraminis]